VDAALHQQRRRSGLPAALHGAGLHTAPDCVALKGVRAVLLDIEGTTTPVEFVHQTLFGYARARARELLEQHWNEPEIREDVTRLRAEHAAESSQSATSPPPPPWRDDITSVADYVYWLMDRDRKSTGLKSLQGKIWEEGYRTGELRGEIYPDVPPAFDRWRRQGVAIAIFSSGSIQAQRSLFGNTSSGDLTGFITAYFDTTTGPKTAPTSYGRIAAALGHSPFEVLFLSDVASELDAARAAGMRTTLCVRTPGTALPAGPHPVIRGFDEVI